MCSSGPRYHLMHISRRKFLKRTAVATASITAASALAPSLHAAPAPEFRSAWDKTHDRVWPGAEYWSNPLQDWRIAGGRLECIKAAADRNLHLLTRQLGEPAGDLKMSVRLGRVGGGPLGKGGGSAGFRIGVQGPLREYRNNAIFGKGLDAGFTGDGKLFLGALGPGGESVDLNHESVELRLAAVPKGDAYQVTLSAHHPTTGAVLGQVVRDNIAPDRLVGNLALVANYPAGAPGDANAKAKKKAAAAPGGTGQFWFADWRVSGSKVEAHEDQAFGPILFSHYSLSAGVLKMTAQMPPLGPKESPTVRLQVKKGGAWSTIGEEKIHPDARTATFRVASWNAQQDADYRLAYTLLSNDGKSQEHFWTGTVRRDPVDQPVLTVADVSCNIHDAFPNTLYTANMAKLNPDLLAFVGDQFYESTGGYGVQREPLDLAMIDYLRKWYMHGWTWRELTRNRPSLSLPDDHDVYQGNIWGESGAPRKGTQEMGGYDLPGAWINVVHRTQASHHPDPYDATPVQQGISVYYGPMVYGRVSFAVLADRQFKSGPEGKVPATGGRGDHVSDPNWKPKSSDLPGLQLLGDRQMKFLRAWTSDWRGADMKAVISQTIFSAMATTHGGGRERLLADYDANGWPQTPRNDALREIRKAFAVHIAGDQHLPAVVHYGIDQHGDGPVAFAGPAVNTGYPRWFEPLQPGRNRKPGAPETTGEFLDHFGHPLTVLAVANPPETTRKTVLERLHDKVSGIGLVRFDKPNRRTTLECWPLLADPTKPGTQFPGWPVVVNLLDNYGQKPSAHLPKLSIAGVRNPVVQVLAEKTGEIVYTLRTGTPTFQPHVFAPGKYTVKVSDPDAKKEKLLTGLDAVTGNQQVVEVTL
jgi:alkaline phosphatase D